MVVSPLAGLSLPDWDTGLHHTPTPGKDHGVILLLPLSLYHAVTPPAKLEREGLLRSAPCVALCPQLQRQQNLRMWLLP